MEAKTKKWHIGELKEDLWGQRAAGTNKEEGTECSEILKNLVTLVKVSICLVLFLNLILQAREVVDRF